jgi:preprotein translocase subunit SecD
MTEHQRRRHWFWFSDLSILIAITIVGGWLGFELYRHRPNRPKPLGKAATLEVHLVSPTSAANTHSISNQWDNTTIFLIDPPVLTAGDFATVQKGQDPDRIVLGKTTEAAPTLRFNLTPEGAAKLSAATSNAKGKSLAIVANGKLIHASKILGTLSNSIDVHGILKHHCDEIFESLTNE